LQVSNCTISLPGKPAVPVALYSPATTTGASSTAATGSTTAAAPLSVVNIQAAELEVVVTPSTTAPSSSIAVDISKVVDTTSPVITLTGGAYVPVLQLDRFVDPGFRAYDHVDGNSVSVISRLQLCARPTGDLQTIRANDTRALALCGAQLASINTTAPSRDNETFVVTYTARDSAGNQAAPLRRYVTVTARYVDALQQLHCFGSLSANDDRVTRWSGHQHSSTWSTSQLTGVRQLFLSATGVLLQSAGVQSCQPALSKGCACGP
jgi:hypothetical protein